LEGVIAKEVLCNWHKAATLQRLFKNKLARKRYNWGRVKKT